MSAATAGGVLAAGPGHTPGGATAGAWVGRAVDVALAGRGRARLLKIDDGMS
jgi:hypothetical protein